MSPHSNMPGRFITFEGIDGAGKSSHIKSVEALLKRQGFEVITTREPGGTGLGERLRELLLHERMHLETEALLMFAARREHLAQVIEPALASGKWVISDRFTDATYAYQCGGRGFSEDKFRSLEAMVHGHLQPDATLLFDLPAAAALSRIKDNRVLDRFEQEKADFHRRVRDAYLVRAATPNRNIHIIDANQSVDMVSASVEACITSLIKRTAR